MIKDFAVQLSNGEATKDDLIPRTCKICKNVETSSVIEQLNINPDDLDENCKSCMGSELK